MKIRARIDGPQLTHEVTLKAKDALQLRRQIAAIPFAPPARRSYWDRPERVEQPPAMRGAHVLLLQNDGGRLVQLPLMPGDDEHAIFARLDGALEVLDIDAAKPPEVALARLNDTQRAVLADTRARAEVRSHAARERLLRKAQRRGFSAAQVDTMLEYLKRQPVTVNFDPDKRLPNGQGTVVDAYLRDGTHKNQFETGISGGSQTGFWGGKRDRWERELFMGGYHGHALIKQERPKYGASNAVGMAAGAARPYGSSYFIMKDSVRERTTFTPQNSSSMRAANVGTADHFQHVLAGVRNDVMQRIYETASGMPPRGGITWHYIEAQVHGPIDFAKDVASIVIHTRFKGTPYETKLRALAQLSGATVQWHDDKRVMDAP